MKKLLLAGVTSGAGKTSVTLGILSALSRRLTVQPYKVGPDYVDTKFHTRITGRGSRNLDDFLIPNQAALQYLFTKDTEDVDIGIVEGVMGLYDGLGTDKDAYSTADIAKKLGIPVVLVVNARSTSTSAAAIVKGFQVFDPEVPIVGVIINNVMSANHYQLVKGAMDRYLDIPVLGYLPHDASVALPSRQLGLVPDAELATVDDKIARLGDLVAEHVDLAALLDLATDSGTPAPMPYQVPQMPIRVGIAQDEAFNFYYNDNLALMAQAGVTLVPFSPMTDQHLPAVDALYLGGGYPEEQAAILSQNTAMRTAICRFSAAGRPIYAECGGLMYLGKALVTEDGTFPMVGIFDGVSTMTSRLKKFGYCYATATTDTLVAAKGQTVAGHEFHHSVFEPQDDTLTPVLTMQKVRDGQVVDEWAGGYQVRRTFASYLHTHLFQSQSLMDQILQQLGAVAHVSH